jgi:hypothetical protein
MLEVMELPKVVDKGRWEEDQAPNPPPLGMSTLN